MKKNSVLLPFLFLSMIGCASHYKVDTTIKSADILVDYTSEEGMRRIERSSHKRDFFVLSNNFESQENGLFCGPTSAAIILNSFRIRSKNAKVPKDKRAVEKGMGKHLPKTYDGLLARYTPNVIVDKSPKPAKVVYGKPVKVKGKEVKDFGYQLRQLTELLRSNGLRVEMRVADKKLSDQQIKNELVKNLQQKGDFVLINYKRSAVGQNGGGHISPVGAYDKKSDSFLVMDVNPTKAPWVWMPTSTLIKGMRTFDTVENRGYLLISEAP